MIVHYSSLFQYFTLIPTMVPTLVEKFLITLLLIGKLMHSAQKVPQLYQFYLKLLHSSTNQNLFKKHLKNQGSHYENYW